MRWLRSARLLLVIIAFGFRATCLGADGTGLSSAGELRAGAYAVEIPPPKLPVIVNGGFLQKQADKLNDPLHARCLVLDQGDVRLAIVVVDTCMMPRELLDRAKDLARRKSGIPTERMLIAATHTHSAPSAMGALGSDPDPAYVEFLPARIAEGIARAAANLEPAEAGWAAVDDFEHTHCRRWIRRPDRVDNDPFGVRSVRANMHPGYQNPDVIGPSGPVDPQLYVLAVRSKAGRPIAVLANYSMHYFGAAPVSADYYGRFAQAISRLIGAVGGERPFVAIMSQGTSGDQQWMDYAQPAQKLSLDAYSEAVARSAHEAYRQIRYQDRISLAMAESTLKLGRRVPDEVRLAWARPIAASLAGRGPRDRPEVYAREAIFLHDEPERELKLQAIRIGDLAIAAIPNEVYALTGLKIKARSPLPNTFNIELANGAEGYIPPPDQHALGGYTTWPARTAGLEVQAEPKIVEQVLGLLERVSGKPQRKAVEPRGAYAELVLQSNPLAYWRLGEMDGPTALDATGHGNEATFSGGVAHYLEGPQSPAFSGADAINRAAHLAGGRLNTSRKGLGNAYSIELWFWNGLPNDARGWTGYLVGRTTGGEWLAICGAGLVPGRLTFSGGEAAEPVLVGKTVIAPKTWHHMVLVRDGRKVTLYLDRNAEPEIEGEAAIGAAGNNGSLVIGGHGDSTATFEGKIDEISLYDRPLSRVEVLEHLRKTSVP